MFWMSPSCNWAGLWEWLCEVLPLVKVVSVDMYFTNGVHIRSDFIEFHYEFNDEGKLQKFRYKHFKKQLVYLAPSSIVYIEVSQPHYRLKVC